MFDARLEGGASAHCTKLQNWSSIKLYRVQNSFLFPHNILYQQRSKLYHIVSKNSCFQAAVYKGQVKRTIFGSCSRTANLMTQESQGVGLGKNLGVNLSRAELAGSVEGHTYYGQPAKQRHCPIWWSDISVQKNSSQCGRGKMFMVSCIPRARWMNQGIPMFIVSPWSVM